MKNTSLMILLSILFLGSSTAFAQEKERKLLLLPLELRGTYRPVQEAELTQLLIENISKVAPNVVPSVYESKTYMMSPEEAARLGREAGVDFVLYGDLSFRNDVKGAMLTGVDTEGYPGGSGVKQGYASRYMVTVAAVGHGKLVNVATGVLVAERPELLLESEYTGAVKGGEKMEALEKKLADICVQQFAKHLVEKLKADTEKK